MVDKGVKQAAQGANSRFDFTGKAQATAQAVRHQASNANKRWNLSSKARHVREDAARALPKVRCLSGQILVRCMLVSYVMHKDAASGLLSELASSPTSSAGQAEAHPKQHQLAAYGSPRSALSAATAGAFWAGMELNQLSREGR